MAEEKIPRKKLIKLCRKLQERVRTVETKHASVAGEGWVGLGEWFSVGPERIFCFFSSGVTVGQKGGGGGA
eukprot:1382640-Amorphochlora_amoeboformis.AAC.1